MNAFTKNTEAIFYFYRQDCAKRKRRYLINLEADFEVYRPAGATRCTHGDEIWHGGGDLSKVVGYIRRLYIGKWSRISDCKQY